MGGKPIRRTLDRTTAAMNALQEEIEDAHRILDGAGISRTDDLDPGARTMTLVQRIEDMAAQWDITRGWSDDNEKDADAARSELADLRSSLAEFFGSFPGKGSKNDAVIRKVREVLANNQAEHDRLICKISELERYSPDQHVIPKFPGERQHAASVLCWCRPRRDEEDPRVVVHDRRAEA